MEEKKVKILVDSMMIAPNPFYVVREALSRKVGFLKFLRRRNDSLNELDSSFWKEGMYDGIELNYPGIGFFDEKWNIKEKKLLEYKNSNYPFYTFHGCFGSLPKRYHGLYFNLASSDKYVKKALQSQIDVASILKKDDKTILVLHPGTAENGNREEALNNIVCNLEFCLDYAKQKGVIITLENVNWDLDKNVLGCYVDDFVYIFNKIQHECLKICFDVGHLNTLVFDKSFRNKRNIEEMEHFKEFIETLADNVAHFHLHYNSCHLNFGKDIQAWKKKFFKWVCESENCNYLDEHMPLNKADESVLQMIKILINKSQVKNYGYMTCEFIPERVFKLIKVHKGASVVDHKESLELIRKMI